MDLAETVLGKGPVGLVGFGVEGRSTLAWLRRQGINNVVIADDGLTKDAVESLRGEGLEVISELHDFAKLARCGVLFRSPGIPPSVSEGLPDGVPVTSQTDWFLRHRPCQTVGITGTKGKSTTTTVLAKLLSASGRTVHVGGNIGTPVFDFADTCREGDVAVLELSAFQLRDATASPDVAVYTNLFEDHLDYFGDFAAYAAAKANIFRHQGPGQVLVLDPQAFPALDLRAYLAEHRGDRAFALQSPGIAAPSIPLPLLAIIATAAGSLGIPEEHVARGCAAFEGLPYRLENVGTFGGVTFIDDSLATVPEAVYLALKSVGNVSFLILGGSDRGVAYRGFLNRLANAFNGTLVLIGPLGRRLMEELEGIVTWFCKHEAETLEAAMAFIQAEARDGDVVLLSPGAASHDAYPSYKERSAHFRELAAAAFAD